MGFKSDGGAIQSEHVGFSTPRSVESSWSQTELRTGVSFVLAHPLTPSGVWCSNGRPWATPPVTRTLGFPEYFRIFRRSIRRTTPFQNVQLFARASRSGRAADAANTGSGT